MPNEGYEISGIITADGEMLFSDVPPGTYTVETSAPGFLTMRQKVQIEGEHRVLTRFVIMKPRPLHVRLSEQARVSPASPVVWEKTPGFLLTLVAQFRM